MRYIAKKAFKYNGVVIQPGEEWIPVGGKFDRLISEQKFLVYLEDERIPARKYRVSKKALAKEIMVEKPKRKYTKRGKGKVKNVRTESLSDT